MSTTVQINGIPAPRVVVNGSTVSVVGLLLTGGASATTLDDLTDVDVASASKGDILQFDGSNWVSVVGSGTGTVTSFSAGDLSPLFTTTETNATTTPALTFTAVTQNKNLVYASSATDDGKAPTFRSLVAADIPDLSGTYLVDADIGVSIQGYSANLAEYAAVNPTVQGLALIDDATAGDQRTTLGGTMVGQAYFTLTNPSAVTFPRMNADNTVTALSASDFRTAIGAGTSSFDGAYSSLSSIPSTFAPSTHATSHQSGGGDAIKLDDLAAPDDNTDLNATTSAHGLLPKLSNSATEFLNGKGAWATPAGGSSSNSFETISVSGQDDVVADSSTDTLTLAGTTGITITTNKTTDTITIAGPDLSGYAPLAGSTFTGNVTLAGGYLLIDNGTGVVQITDDGKSIFGTDTNAFGASSATNIGDNITTSGNVNLSNTSGIIFQDGAGDNTVTFGIPTADRTNSTTLLFAVNDAAATYTLTIGGNATLTGTNTGDQTSVTGNAGTATKLATARDLQTNLASTSAASFDGSANASPGVTGTLAVANGGTGITSFGTGVATALGNNTNSSGGPVTGGAITSSGLTMATARLLGRTTASTGAVEELTLGTDVATLIGLPADGTDVDAIGYRGLPQVSFSAATNIIASHNGKTLLHPSSDTNNRTLTIQANGTLALEVGFAFEVINDSANDVTLAITTDTLVQAGSGTTGSITIPQYGTCFVRKIASTRWYATLVNA